MLSNEYTSKSSKLRRKVSSGMERLVPEISASVMEGKREKNILRSLNELLPPGQWTFWYCFTLPQVQVCLQTWLKFSVIFGFTKLVES